MLKAVIFDYIGTLVKCKGYNMDASQRNLYNALVAEGFQMAEDKFFDAYKGSHEKYRIVRYEQHREVTNAVWVAEALCSLGFEVTADDPRVKGALNVFFQDFIDTLELRVGAKKLLSQTQTSCKIGLISNFTHAPVIHKSLRAVGISEYFNAVLVSEESGWRKPRVEIFQDMLTRLQVKVEEAVYVGDSPLEDIKGAKDAGLRTVFVTSQFNPLRTLQESCLQPDYVTKNLTQVSRVLNEISSSDSK